MRRTVLALGLALLVAAALVWAVPFLTRDQGYTAATPQPDPLFVMASIALEGGREACMEGAVLDPYSEQARVRVSTPGPSAMPLELTLRGRDYFAAARIPATYADHAAVTVPVQPPRRAVQTTICLRNLGRETAELAASDDRTNARRLVEVDGQPVPQNFVITFSEREPHSIAGRLPVSLRRASAFRPAVSPALLWPLLVLFGLGVPLGVLGAYVWSLRE